MKNLCFILFMGLIPCGVLARELPNPPIAVSSFSGQSGFASSVVSNLLPISYKSFTQNSVEFLLPNGIRLGGFLFLKDDHPRPLIIANFGVLTDRWSNTVTNFVNEIVFGGKIDAHVLVVDSVSGPGFLAFNRSLSLGGYDEGRILNQLADVLDKHTIPFTTLHLMGVSLGGAAAIQALIEDARLGTKHFRSAIGFSSLIDQATITDCVLRTYGYSIKNSSGCKLNKEDVFILDALLPHFNSTLKFLNHDGSIRFTTSNAGKKFYDLFDQRLQSLNANEDVKKTWNPDVKLDSVESYLQTSTAILHNADQIDAPLILIHSQDDPLVPIEPFNTFAARETDTMDILTLATPYGGHWGYFDAYGADWIADLIERMLKN